MKFMKYLKNVDIIFQFDRMGVIVKSPCFSGFSVVKDSYKPVSRLY